MDELPVSNEEGLLTSEMNDYFSSIEDLFENSLKPSGQKNDFIGSIFDFSMTVTILSVVPIIPAIVWGLIRWLAPHWALAITGWALPTHSFLLWWLVCIALSVLAAFSSSATRKWGSKLDAENSLEMAPMRFALCYAIVREIDRFTKNRLPKHIDRALLYWEMFIPMLLHMLSLTCGRHRYMGHGGQLRFVDFETGTEFYEAGIPYDGPRLHRPAFQRIEMLEKAYPWFRLTPSTSKIVEALNSLDAKVAGRLNDKKDLPSIAQVLSNLAAYLYCTIPELSSTDQRGSKETEALGERNLVRFADAIEPLAPYCPEPRPLVGKEKVRFRLAAVIDHTAALFSHENPLLKFFAWLILTLLLVIAALAISSHYVAGLKMDSTLITLVIGTPLLVSAAALAGPLRRK